MWYLITAKDACHLHSNYYYSSTEYCCIMQINQIRETQNSLMAGAEL